MDTIGHNNPPDAIADLIATLRETHQPLVGRLEEIEDAARRVPETVEDDDVGNRVADFIKVCTAFTKNADAARVAAKEPHLAAGRAVDGFFRKLADPVDALKLALSRKLTAYQRKREAEERRRREEEAERQRQAQHEAERAAREAAAQARKAEGDKAASEAEARRLRDEARQAKEAAERAAEAAKAKPAELSRTRTDLGAVASLRRTWGYEVIDAEAVPRMFLTVDHAAIKAFIKSSTDRETGECRAKIPGILLVERHDTVVL